LLDCLVFLTAAFGQAKSAEAIRAGLAYDEKGMMPTLFCEAADRLGLNAKITQCPDIAAIAAPLLPCVLILKDNKACVLTALKGNKARAFFPESGAEKDISANDLKKAAAGYAIYVHPRPAFADPESHAAQKEEHAKHWFWGAVADSKGIYGRVILASFLINLFGLTGSIYIMNVYDRVIPNNAVETGWVLAIGALTVFVFDFIIRTLRGHFLDMAGRRIDVEVSRRLYDQLLDIKLASRPVSSGAFANMLRDFDSIRDFFTSATLTALVDLPFTIIFLGVIWLLAGPLAFMLFSLMLIVIGIGLLLQIPLRGAVQKSLNSGEARHGLLVETIHGLETVKAIGADGRLRARYGTHVGEGAARGEKSRFISALGVNAATFLQQSSSIILVLLGMYLVKDGNLTVGALIATVLLSSRAIAPIGQIANLMTRYHQSKGALKTLEGIMALPVERPHGKRFLHRPNLDGKLTFDKVSFSYPNTGNRKVLDGVSFTISAGEKVGIVGRIGSGKSTIARLILGLYEPSDGTILADDTDFRQIDPADLRRNMAYIAQDVVLFRGSVRENIAISRPQATEEEILEAAKAAGVHDFVSRHPMGYDAPVGEGGANLSGGQRQAIALARAMLLHPAIMVCDEPTNAMDMQAEEAFSRHIGQQIAGKTFILITHRQHLLSLVDRLIVMDQGKVVMDAPRDTVLAALAGRKVEVGKSV
jgi:ATP-binding cassette subfamily C protein LapB